MSKEKNVSIARIVGSSAHTEDERQKNDFYATDPQVLCDFLDKLDKDGIKLANSIWECAVGDGELARVLLEREYRVIGSDIVDRGFPNTHLVDFLKSDQEKVWKGDIVTNPPYKLAQKFVEKALSKINEGSLACFLFRIQFLEGQKRKSFFAKTPPKFVYVHSKRINIYKNNDKEKYTGTNPLAFAWFVWEKGFTGETTIRWI